MKLPTPHTLLLTLIILATASCTRYRDLVLLQEQTTDADTTKQQLKVPTYRIQKRDILYIRIISMNKEVTEVINLSSAASGNQVTSEAGLYLSGYNVSDSGYVEIPMIGKVKVVGKSLEEARMAVAEQTRKMIKDPTVILKLVSFKYSVMGEVDRPGTFLNYNDQLTVLEAISQAGNVTAFANIHNVMVIRTQGNKTLTFPLDLTNRNILNSEGYYLLPNDVVYVEPARSYNFRNNIPTLSVILGAVSTLILIINFVNGTSGG